MNEQFDYVETSTEDLVDAELPAYLSALLCTFIITGFVLALAHNYGLLNYILH